MGIITNIKGKIKTGLTNAANAAANSISEAAELSIKQIEKIEEKKKAYLAEKPDMNSDQNQEHIKRILGTIGVEVYHAYLTELNSKYIPVTSVPAKYSALNRIAYFDITKWVLDVDENYLDKLVNVYHVLSQEECTIALIFNRTIYDCKVTMAVVNNSEGIDPSIVKSYIERLKEAITGNFPGVVLSDEVSNGIPDCLADYKSSKNIATVTNIATEKSEKFISQSIEKLLDGVVPQNKEQEYTFVLLATPTLESFSGQSRLSELYTMLSPYSEWQTNYTFMASEVENSSFVAGVHLGANVGASVGNGQTETNGGNIGVGGGQIPVNASISHSNALAHNTGANAGLNFGVNFNRSSNVSINIAKNEGITQSFTNHQIKHTLDIIDLQMKRLEQCSALGMWKFASYVISEDYNTTNNVAHMYLALTQGEESFISQAAVNLWHANCENKTKTLLREISHLHHPVFCLNAEDDWLMYPTTVDATTTISGRELAYSFNLPKKSVAGFPVLECAEFGRNVVTYNTSVGDTPSLKLGNIFHMNHKENNNVFLEKNSLASHTFITGSTGSGKSNTVYKILSEARKSGTKFLVVEPAKGEYKYVFGNDVAVYGTNPNISSLLRINPFSFPNGIHVLEHLDRLVEIFNVCWPMYAAMPAVLKNAIEKSYEDCGWDLTESENVYGDNLYPQFSDVARNVKLIIDSSEYDTENKGAYKGSLLTRLNSLTNGINGLIFTDDELSMENLFDENVIVDLSRVGSSETKSLIMGMLVLKLQEYRMTQGEMNAPLKHITVLEEAHNLLKRTSTEQVSDSANLIGKSVEMISNAIAEMRTYGEGFIIADQSPGLLDMAAIRNTNTKIIMRLPDITDRELVGKAANLNDNQITELAKLPCGVAAIYQNEWIQSVLCKVEKYDTVEKKYDYQRNKTIKFEVNSNDMVNIAHMLSNGIGMKREAILKEIMPLLQKNNIKASVQVAIAKQLENPPKEPRMTKLAPIMSALFPKVRNAVISAYKDNSDVSEWTRCAEEALLCSINYKINDITRRDIIQANIVQFVYNELGKELDLQNWTRNGGIK